MAGEDAATDWLRRLMGWLSPAYPVGAFTYSHGLEWAVEAGHVHDRASLEDWLGQVLRHGSGRTDAILFAHAYAAAALGDRVTLSGLKDLGAALAPGDEVLVGASSDGQSAGSRALAAWPDMANLTRLLPLDPAPAYPIAVGAAAAVAGVPLLSALEAYLQAFAGNLVTAGVGLIPLDEEDGERAMAALAPRCIVLADEACVLPLDDLATATLMVDWCSMRHETRQQKLFKA